MVFGVKSNQKKGVDVPLVPTGAYAGAVGRRTTASAGKIVFSCERIIKHLGRMLEGLVYMAGPFYSAATVKKMAVCVYISPKRRRPSDRFLFRGKSVFD